MAIAALGKLCPFSLPCMRYYLVCKVQSVPAYLPTWKDVRFFCCVVVTGFVLSLPRILEEGFIQNQTTLG